MMSYLQKRYRYGSGFLCGALLVLTYIPYVVLAESKNPATPQEAAGKPVPLPKLSPTLPLAITVTGKVSLASLQHDFDDFSWRTFIALNWPANADGTPNTHLTIGQSPTSPVVWQTWKESREIFLPQGAKPLPWNTQNPLPEVCKDIKNVPSDVLFLTQVGKTPNVLDESGQPFQTGPLIDQNGQYTRYEILTNETMFNFIVENSLYSAKGQKEFKNKISFPISTQKPPKVGSIMLKAAWIKMGGKFDEKKFHTATALVYDNPHEQKGVKPACSLEKVGLVGFHIAHKTEAEPQWIWSTFEHVANAPTAGDSLEFPAYNFFDPNCSNCKINLPPPRPWNPANPHTTPSQIKRIIPISDDAKALNKLYQTALSAIPNSVWQNYELISTQWPTNGTSKTDPTGVPAPSFLANATLETYIQGEVKQTSSSCMGCHNNATDTSGKPSDFTYLLQRAQ